MSERIEYRSTLCGHAWPVQRGAAPGACPHCGARETGACLSDAEYNAVVDSGMSWSRQNEPCYSGPDGTLQVAVNGAYTRKAAP